MLGDELFEVGGIAVLGVFFGVFVDEQIVSDTA